MYRLVWLLKLLEKLYKTIYEVKALHYMYTTCLWNRWLQKHISCIAEKHTAVLTPELFGLQWHHHSSKWYSKESMGYTKHFPQNRFKLVCGEEKDGAGLTPGETHGRGNGDGDWGAKTSNVLQESKHPFNTKVTTYWHPNIFITARAKTPRSIPGVDPCKVADRQSA